MWHKPNDLYAILRCTNVKFAKKLVDLGSIKFNTPESWAKAEKESGKGRGDVLEGTFAACHPLDIEDVISYSNQYKDVFGETINGLTYFRRKRTMKLPCYCFYLLKQSSFETPQTAGKQKISTIIPSEYFRDFADNLSKEEVLSLSEEERPAIVVINNIDQFLAMVRSKLLSIGVKNSEIIFELIEYADKSVPHYCTKESPKELKLKDKYFQHQSEGRIIINTDNQSVIDYLDKNSIDIGTIETIAKRADVYLNQGVLIEMNADVYEINE